MNYLINDKQLTEYSLNIEVYQFDCLNTLNAFDQTKMFENIEIFEAWRDSRTNKIIDFNLICGKVSPLSETLSTYRSVLTNSPIYLIALVNEISKFV